MKSAKLQLLVTLAAIVTATTIFAAKGLPPTKHILVASREGNLVQVRRALNWGADANNKHGGGFSPLHLVAYSGRVDVASLLLAHGADINAQDEESWATPLHVAAQSGCGGVADSGWPAHGGWAATDIGFAALALGTRRDCTDLVQHLIDCGANVKARDAFGQTPLHRAALCGNRDIVKLLLAHGAEVNAKDDAGATPLHGAAIHGSKKVAELLISEGADVNAKVHRGTSWTVFAIATLNGHKDIADLLRQHGAKK